MMLTILRLLLLIPTALRLRSEPALENLALRRQLAVLKRRHRRPRLWKSDRFFRLLLSRSWSHWKETLVILPAHTDSRASPPGVRLDFAFRESRREGRDKPGDSKRRSAGILAKHSHSSLERRLQLRHHFGMIGMDKLVGAEWAEWYRLTPGQRWLETGILWHSYLMMGGSLDPEPDTQSPFFDPRAPRSRPPHGRPGMRVIRRSRI